MLGLLGVLIIGLIVGAIAKLIVPGKEPGGCLVTSAIGVAGSFVAFYLGTLLGWTFRQSRQLAAGWLYPITDRSRYPAACLPLDTPAIRALNATRQAGGCFGRLQFVEDICRKEICLAYRMEAVAMSFLDQ